LRMYEQWPDCSDHGGASSGIGREPSRVFAAMGLVPLAVRLLPRRSLAPFVARTQAAVAEEAGSGAE
jgi:hypothetical protein